MILSTFAFIDARFGPEARAKVQERAQERLPDDQRALLRNVASDTWVPLGTFAHLLHAMDDELGHGDLELVTQRGEWTATRDLTTIRKLILKFVPGAEVVERATSLWPKLHDSGKWSVARTAPNHARAELSDLAFVDPAICASVKGWIVGLAKLTGSRRVGVVHTQCRVRGDSVCTFEIDWK